MWTSKRRLKATSVGLVMAATGLWLGAAPSAFAARPAGDPTPAVLAQSNCRGVADPLARVACYDRAVDAFEKSKAQGDVVVVDRAQVREVRRQAFGLRLPSLSLLPHLQKDDLIDKLTLTVDHAALVSDGKWSMTADEGAVWVQTDNAVLARDPHKGSTLAINAGALGGYFCKVDGQPVIRCQRQR